MEIFRRLNYRYPKGNAICKKKKNLRIIYNKIIEQVNQIKYIVTISHMKM
jgi:hypothetical protein